MKMLMKTEWKIKMQIKIEIKTKNTKQNVNDDRKTQMQMQIEIKVAEPPRIPYKTDQNGANTIPFGATHAYEANTGSTPPRANHTEISLSLSLSGTHIGLP